MRRGGSKRLVCFSLDTVCGAAFSHHRLHLLPQTFFFVVVQRAAALSLSSRSVCVCVCVCSRRWSSSDVKCHVDTVSPRAAPRASRSKLFFPPSAAAWLRHRSGTCPRVGIIVGFLRCSWVFFQCLSSLGGLSLHNWSDTVGDGARAASLVRQPVS